MKFEHLLNPIKIRGVFFKNRVMASPASLNLSYYCGALTPMAIEQYSNRARGGFASVTVGETFIDRDRSGRARQGLNILPPISYEDVQSLYAVIEAIQSHGAVASLEINHVGALTEPQWCNGKNPISASSFVTKDGIQVEEMDEAMMDTVAENFATAALYAKELGFQMVLIHGGHGWLLSQFLSSATNKRTDNYGGSIENRARFPLMVVDRIREKVGENFVIEYRLSAQERIPGGITLEETCRFAELLDGKVDIIHVSTGYIANHVQTKQFTSMFDPHGFNLKDASFIKQHLKKTLVSCVGGINDPNQAEEAIATGMCDFVVLGRQQIADPYWVKKVEQGREDEIAPCLRCSCFNPARESACGYPHAKYRTCTVNPRAGREVETINAPRPNGSRKVLVIGGGVGGMYAALTAAERGHVVTLCEKEEKLGGTLWFTDYDKHKVDLRKYRDSLITRLNRSNVDVITNLTVDIEYIKKFKPDHIICGIGADPRSLNIPGLEQYASPMLSAYGNLGKIGQKVAFIGGGLVGCESALLLADMGKEVTILEVAPSLAAGANKSHYQALMPLIDEKVTALVSVNVTEVTDTGVYYSDKDGKKQFIEADTVVYATGMLPRTKLMDDMRKAGIPFTAIGDCAQPANVEKAVFQGFTAAMDIL